jgi:ParB-like chromosome segregation protein Spo0J
MEQEHDLNGGDWESVAARVARRLKIDRYGLTRRRLNVLMALVKLPPLPPDQYEALRQNIAVNGVLVPILVDSDGPKRRIIDGNYRKRIATELGYDCPEVVHQGDDEELRTLARALNLARRQMTTDQKRQVIAAQLRETPTRTNRWVAKMLGVTHPTVASVRAVGG